MWNGYSSSPPSPSDTQNVSEGRRHLAIVFSHSIVFCSVRVSVLRTVSDRTLCDFFSSQGLFFRCQCLKPETLRTSSLFPLFSRLSLLIFAIDSCYTDSLIKRDTLFSSSKSIPKYPDAISSPNGPLFQSINLSQATEFYLFTGSSTFGTRIPFLILLPKFLV